MSKNAFTDFDTIADNNTDVGGIGIEGTDAVENFDNGLRKLMAIIAGHNNGALPISDLWTFGDPDDLTKRVRIDAGDITTGETRVLTAPDKDGTIPILADVLAHAGSAGNPYDADSRIIENLANGTAAGHAVNFQQLKAASNGAYSAADYGFSESATSAENKTALQAAIDAAKADGRGAAVTIPQGLFNVDGGITLWPNVPVIGMNSWTTVINIIGTGSDPALIMGDQAWREGGGSPTTKGWSFQGLRVETSTWLGHGVYLVGIAGSFMIDVQTKGFVAGGKYGLIVTGNNNSGDGWNTDLAEASTQLEGHYNTFIGVYCFGNDNGMYLGGKAGLGQSNTNTFINCSIRQNNAINFLGGATNNNTFIGCSFEAKSGTNFGVFCPVDWFLDNRFINARFEGTYDVAPWRILNNTNSKRNFMDIPSLGAGYGSIDPSSTSFTADPGQRNYITQFNSVGDLIDWGPRRFKVSLAGMGYYGSTTQRPVFGGNGILYRGLEYYDTSLGAMIYWNGTQWKRCDTNATV